MKMERFEVVFESRFETTVYAPAGTPIEKIHEIAREIARAPLRHGWDFPDHEAAVAPMKPLEARMVINLPAIRNPGMLVFEPDIDTVLSDDGKDLVLPSDAKWWKEG